MYSEFQEQFIYSIIWLLVAAEGLASVALIYAYGTNNIGASLTIVAINVLIGFGMYKYTLWLKKQRGRRKSPHNQAL